MKSIRLLHAEADKLLTGSEGRLPVRGEKGKSEAAYQHAMQALYAEALRRTLRRLRSGNHRHSLF